MNGLEQAKQWQIQKSKMSTTDKKLSKRKTCERIPSACENPKLDRKVPNMILSNESTECISLDNSNGLYLVSCKPY